MKNFIGFTLFFLYAYFMSQVFVNFIDFNIGYLLGYSLGQTGVRLIMQNASVFNMLSAVVLYISMVLMIKRRYNL